MYFISLKEQIKWFLQVLCFYCEKLCKKEVIGVVICILLWEKFWGKVRQVCASVNWAIYSTVFVNAQILKTVCEKPVTILLKSPPHHVDVRWSLCIPSHKTVQKICPLPSGNMGLQSLYMQKHKKKTDV